MKKVIKKLIVYPVLYLMTPLTYLAALWLKLAVKCNVKAVKSISISAGVLPIIDHYYQPLINPRKHLKKSLRENRNLSGAIDFNIKEQLGLLNKFNYNRELVQFPIERTDAIEFYYNNTFYSSGDAEYLYNIIRYFKPKRIIEIGSGNSTLMAINAIAKNKIDDATYSCHHICVEPYEMPWLRSVEVELKIEKVENIGLSFFQQLKENDILFIDSSHIIRTQGDVLFEYLELLPTLNSGVLIHVHDIFTPKDYLDKWIYDDHLLWNEQYLLEAFLIYNSEFKIIGATNYLAHNHYEAFAAKCPIFEKQTGCEPGAFWMQKK